VKLLAVDVNVILDVLLAREPHLHASSALWAAIEEGRAAGLLPAHGFTTIFYLVAKQQGRAAASQVVSDLLGVFGVAPVDEGVLRRAAALELTDFEDAVVAGAAEAAHCEVIVTRDPAGFSGSPVPAVEPLLALAALDSEIHEPLAAYGGRRRRRSPQAERPPQLASD
jgi:predicted nucleic acid-binding protein